MYRGKVIGLCAALVLLSATLARAELSIIETVMAEEDFKTLVTALKATDLVTKLEGEGPFTIFAPTDAAFETLGEETLNDLLDPANKAKLTRILRSHVVAGVVMASDMENMSEVKSVEGVKLGVEVYDGEVMINDTALIETTDIECTNGVIHVIDTVLVP